MQSDELRELWIDQNAIEAWLIANGWWSTVALDDDAEHGGEG